MEQIMVPFSWNVVAVDWDNSCKVLSLVPGTWQSLENVTYFYYHYYCYYHGCCCYFYYDLWLRMAPGKFSVINLSSCLGFCMCQPRQRLQAVEKLGIEKHSHVLTLSLSSHLLCTSLLSLRPFALRMNHKYPYFFRDLILKVLHIFIHS